MSLISVDELADWLGECTFEQRDHTRAEAILAAASTLVLDHTGQVWTEATCPPVARIVVKQIATRVYQNPNGLVMEERQGVLTRYRDDVTGEITLTDSERVLLRPFLTDEKAGRGRQVSVISTTRWEGAPNTIYVPTDGGSPIPWYVAPD